MTPQPIDATAAPALARLVDQVLTARAAQGRLRVCGGGSKDWYGHAPQGERLDVRPLAGVSSYEPSELVVTVRAGTPLAELEALLAEQGQHLAFEPPRFGAASTVGGVVAAGLAGPARASAGAVRDHVLGATVLNGRGELLSFGGQVMKNVAGYDAARLFAGSLGALGVVCEVSLKVLPLPPAVATLRFELDASTALQRVNEWSGEPLPLSASACWNGMLLLRLAGAHAAVRSAMQRLGGEGIEPSVAQAFWQGLRDHTDEFFTSAAQAVEGGAALWRLGLPATAPVLPLPGEQLIEWGGAQRWICTPLPHAVVREAAAALGGHATLWRAQDKRAGAFQPLAPVQRRIQLALAQSFDPDHVFDRERLFGAA